MSGANLIIHCDDLGLSPSVNRATFVAFDLKLITSASVIMVSPFVGEVGRYFSEHPDLDLGIHLTLTSEWPNARWKPLSPPQAVPSLVDQDGYLWSSVEAFAENAKGNEIERELHAQIDAAYSIGLRPSHVDNHMFSLFSTRNTMQAYFNVARRRHLACLSLKNVASLVRGTRRGTEGVLDSVRIASTSWRSEHWLLHYMAQLATIACGVSQLIVHLGYDEPDLQLATGRFSAWGSAWRQRDFDAMCRPELTNTLRELGISLISWNDVAKSPLYGRSKR